MIVKTAAHTPTPWTLGPAKTRGDFAISWPGGEAASPCGYSSWEELATVYGSDSQLEDVQQEARANADLIVRAVNAHAALVAVAKNQLRVANLMGDEKLADNARAALALARGDA